MSALPRADLPDAVERVAASVVGFATRHRASSGVLWRDGIAVGSASALWRSTSVSVLRPDGEPVRGEVRGLDPATDLAAVAVPGLSQPLPARSAGAAPRVGDFVFAAGRKPSGITQASFGRVGAVGGEWRTWRGGRIERLLQLDGGLYAGFEGGAVADADGGVLGIASPAFSRQRAIVLPATTVDRVLDQLLVHGRVVQGWLGIAAQPVQAALDGETVRGLLVSSVAEDGPAAKGGLQVGDVIVKVAGRPVERLDALRDALQVGADVSVLVSRGGKGTTLTLTVASRPGARCCG
jgi:S1-C subfamily serine protease